MAATDLAASAPGAEDGEIRPCAGTECAGVCEHEASEQRLIESYRMLHQVNIELSQAVSPVELCRRAVELGRGLLGFERLGIWLLGEEPGVALGMFGIDEEGRLRDERSQRFYFPTKCALAQVADEGVLLFNNSIPLRNHLGEILGIGEQAIAPLRDSERTIGFLFADTLLTHSPITPVQRELLKVFGDIIGHLYEQKQAYADLRMRHEYSRLIEKNVQDVIWTMDLSLRFVYVSPSIMSLIGYTPEEAETLSLEKSLTPASLAKALQVYQEEQAIESTPGADPHRSRTLELELYRKDGSTVWVEVNLAFLRDLNRQPIGILGITRDISQRKQAERSLRVSEERFRNIFNQSSVGIEVYDADGKLVDSNPACLAIFGMRRLDDVKGFNLFRNPYLTPECQQRLLAGETVHFEFRFDFNEIKRLDLYLTTERGQKDIDALITPLRADGEGITGYLAQLQDITKRRQMERDLQRSEAEMRALVDHLPAITYSTQLDGNYPTLYVSPQLEAILGFTPGEWCTDPTLYYRQIHPDDLEAVIDALAACQRTGKPFLMEYRIFARDGREHWMHDEAITLPGDDGKPHYFQGVMLDITERKHAEQYEEQLRLLQESERMKSEFISLTSHELKTPLTPILGVIELLADEVLGTLNMRQREALAMADRQARRLHRLVDDLLVLFRLESDHFTLNLAPVDLCAIMQESLEAYAQRYREKGLLLRGECGGPVPHTLGDAQRLAQVLDNLLGNALKYTAQGEVTVTLSACEQAIVLVVADTGCGISLEQQTRIFERFYQVDEHREGAGLGLAIVRQLVEAHGGSIRVESTPGTGSTFIVTLPIRDGNEG